MTCLDPANLLIRPQLCWHCMCRIPRAYLQATKPFLGPEMAEAPLIVFINSRSGGHAGPKLTETLFRALGQAQVLVCEKQGRSQRLQNYTFYAASSQRHKELKPMSCWP